MILCIIINTVVIADHIHMQHEIQISAHMMLLLLCALPMFSHQRLSFMSYTSSFPGESQHQHTPLPISILMFEEQFCCITLREVSPPPNASLHTTPCDLASDELVHQRVGGGPVAFLGRGSSTAALLLPPPALGLEGRGVKLQEPGAPLIPDHGKLQTGDHCVL